MQRKTAKIIFHLFKAELKQRWLEAGYLNYRRQNLKLAEAYKGLKTADSGNAQWRTMELDSCDRIHNAEKDLNKAKPSSSGKGVNGNYKSLKELTPKLQHLLWEAGLKLN